jgi:hypothetical protein
VVDEIEVEDQLFSLGLAKFGEDGVTIKEGNEIIVFLYDG